MRDISTPPKTNLFRLFLLLILACFLTAGCGSDNGGPTPQDGPGPDGNPVTAADEFDNSDFYGTYLVTATIGACEEEIFTLIIGNDLSRAGEDNYVYLPESGDDTSIGHVTVTRDERSVTIRVDEAEYDLWLTILFDEDLTTATYTGKVLADTGCDGDVEGTVTLVTKNPAEISDAYIQDRIYPDAGNNTQAAWLQVSKDGMVMDQAAMLNAKLYRADGETTLLGQGDGASGTAYLYGASGQDGVIAFEETDRNDMGIPLDLSATLTAGDYIVEAEIRDGEAQYTIKKQITYPGDTVELPTTLHISDAEMNNIAGSDYGPITLSWESLETPQPLYISFMKSGQVLMMVEVPEAPEEGDALTTLTIPAEGVKTLLERANLIDNYDLLAIQLHTRQYTDAGMNHARGYSQTELIADTATGDDVDNKPFYGAYGLDFGDSISITIGNNPDSACFDDYLYLPADILSMGDMGPCTASVTRNADTLTFVRNGRTLIFDFDYNRDIAVVSEMLPEGENPVKTERGTAGIITRDPAVVLFSSIKGNYLNGDFFGQTVSMALSINGEPIDTDAIVNLNIIDSENYTYPTNDPEDFQNISFKSGDYIKSDSEDILTIQDNPFEWSGINFDYPRRSSLSQGEYTFIATINHSTGAYTVTCKVTSPGNRNDDGEEPVQTGPHTFELTPGNDMDISCILTDNDFDELHINILEFIFPGTFTKKLDITIDRSEIVEDKVELKIPSDIVSDLIESEDLFLELETVKNTEPGMLIHRGYIYEQMIKAEPVAE